MALAACAAPPQSTPPQPTARAPAKPRPPAAKPPQSPAVSPTPPAPSQEAAPAPAVPVPAPVPAPTPEKLKGMNEAETVALLGEPAGRAERPPARIWFYETAECRLELAFYLDVSGSGFHVLSHKAVPKGPTPLTGAACVERLRSAKR